MIPLSRRQLLKDAATGFGSTALLWMLHQEQARGAAVTPPPRIFDLHPKKPVFPAKAKSVIFLFMGGGPSAVDMLDPKPALPYGGEHGMWVIAHTEQTLIRQPYPGPVVSPPSAPGTPTPWPVPWFGGMVYSNGPIVAVQPSEPNGGVLPDGRPYTP